MKSKLLLIGLLALVAGAPRAGAKASPEATRIRVEVLHVVREGGELKAAPDAITGVTREDYKVPLAESTDRIPLLIGHGVGFGFILEGRFRALKSVQLKVTYPKMHSPTHGILPGSVDRTQEAYDVGSDHVVDFCYFFDEEWELVEGQWHIEIWEGGQKLAEADASTYHPEPAPSPERATKP